MAVDGSEHSLRATQEAIKIASLANECTVEIVFVVDYAKAKNEVIHAQGKEELELSRRKRLYLLKKKLKEKSYFMKLKYYMVNQG